MIENCPGETFAQVPSGLGIHETADRAAKRPSPLEVPPRLRLHRRRNRPSDADTRGHAVILFRAGNREVTAGTRPGIGVAMVRKAGIPAVIAGM